MSQSASQSVSQSVVPLVTVI